MSEVSARSSVSSGRAARRARWRANKAARARSPGAGSDLTYTLPTRELEGSDVSYTVPPVGVGTLSEPAVVEGYCYEAALHGSYREVARAALGQRPTFGELLSSPSFWFRDEFGRLAVSRVEPGLFHVSCDALVPWVTCLASIVQGVSVQFPLGSFGARPCFTSLSLSQVLLVKAPGLGDRCGAAGGASVSRAEGCHWCSAALAYQGGSGEWGASVEQVPVSDKHLVREVVLPSGVLLVVYKLSGRSAVIPFSDRKDATTTVVMGLATCRVHSVQLAECGCSVVHAQSSDRFPVHVVGDSGVAIRSCAGYCQSGGSLTGKAKAWVSAIKSGFKVTPWVMSEPSRLERLGAYRLLGGFPGQLSEPPVYR